MSDGNHPPQDWRAECAYCAQQAILANTGNTSSTFNNDPSCLRRYIQMQHRMATLQKQPTVAMYLQQIIDALSFFA